MKKTILILLISLSLFLAAKAQKFNIEPGITVGTSYYLGDINHTRQFYSPGLTLGLVFRHTFSDFYAIRINLLRASVSGNDADFSSLYQQQRAWAFNSSIYEIGAQYEINFLSFNTGIKKSQAPYLTLGIAVAGINSFRTISPVIPIGVGYKYSPTKRMTLNAEWCFRNTFTDRIDNLVQENFHQKQITKIKTNDWYSVLGITLTYNFASDKKWCPAYSKPKKH